MGERSGSHTRFFTGLISKIICFARSMRLSISRSCDLSLRLAYAACRHQSVCVSGNDRQQRYVTQPRLRRTESPVNCPSIARRLRPGDLVLNPFAVAIDATPGAPMIQGFTGSGALCTEFR